MASVYTRKVDDFSGIGGGTVDDCQNLIRLYIKGGEEPPLTTVPGYRMVAKPGGSVNGIFRYGSLPSGEQTQEYLIVHAGKQLYVFSGEGDLLGKAEGEVRDAVSTAFRFGDALYLLDGEGYYRLTVTQNGTENPELIAEPVGGYYPTVSSEGAPYEAANIYASNYYEKLTVTDPGRYAVGSEGLVYAVTSEADREAAVISGTEAAGEVVIPATVNIRDRNYRVTSVGDRAFQFNTAITSLILGSEVERIGSRAFLACTSLAKVVTNGKLSVIGVYAFSRCHALFEICFSEQLHTVEKGAFNECTALMKIEYGGTDLLGEVSVDSTGNDSFFLYSINNHASVPSVETQIIRLPFTVPGKSLVSVTFGGAALSADPSGALYYRPEYQDGYVTAVTVFSSDPAKLYGKLLVAELSESKTGISAVHPSYLGSSQQIICRCTVGAVYDGRIFLTGNPDLPGTVFYSGKTAEGAADPGYFGIYNYFRDGDAGAETVGLCPTPQGLYVFTGETAGCGIYRHTGSDSGQDFVPRIYPSDGGHYLSGEYRASILYRDEVLILSSRGVCAIRRDRALGETVLEPRDEGFFGAVGCSASASLESWLGYLAVIDGDRILLGDGRRVHRTPSGGTRYEWWRLSGICGYETDKAVYRYASREPQSIPSPFEMPPIELQGKLATGTIVSADGFYAEQRQDGKFLLVMPTGEKKEGTQYPIRACYMRHDVCFFGCQNGGLYRFSTDKIGLPPSGAIDEYDSGALVKFRERNPDYLAPEWYSFAGHPIEARLLTALDDCGSSTQLKSTVPKSTVLECASAGAFRVTALTSDGSHSESGEVLAAGLDFAWLAFDALAFTDGARTPTVFRENTKKWHSKQYAITSQGAFSPLEIRRIGYMYTNAGKVRN